ncbi:hypothetical protein BDZ89DRAFT_1116059 [Hymenopellis radicata]|nr:hypothetical protein BDZ89DRAFT_1116059 [Hymenopellis radicata]
MPLHLQSSMSNERPPQMVINHYGHVRPPPISSPPIPQFPGSARRQAPYGPAPTLVAQRPPAEIIHSESTKRQGITWMNSSSIDVDDIPTAPSGKLSPAKRRVTPIYAVSEHYAKQLADLSKKAETDLGKRMKDDVPERNVKPKKSPELNQGPASDVARLGKDIYSTYFTDIGIDENSPSLDQAALSAQRSGRILQVRIPCTMSRVYDATEQIPSLVPSAALHAWKPMFETVTPLPIQQEPQVVRVSIQRTIHACLIQRAVELAPTGQGSGFSGDDATSVDDFDDEGYDGLFGGDASSARC